MAAPSTRGLGRKRPRAPSARPAAAAVAKAAAARTAARRVTQVTRSASRNAGASGRVSTWRAPRRSGRRRRRGGSAGGGARPRGQVERERGAALGEDAIDRGRACRGAGQVPVAEGHVVEEAELDRELLRAPRAPVDGAHVDAVLLGELGALDGARAKRAVAAHLDAADEGALDGPARRGDLGGGDRAVVIGVEPGDEADELPPGEEELHLHGPARDRVLAAREADLVGARARPVARKRRAHRHGGEGRGSPRCGAAQSPIGGRTGPPHLSRGACR